MVIDSDFRMDAEFFVREDIRKAAHAGIGNRGEFWRVKGRHTRKRDGIVVTITDDKNFSVFLGVG
jgi:hypothetical protein